MIKVLFAILYIAGCSGVTATPPSPVGDQLFQDWTAAVAQAATPEVIANIQRKTFASLYQDALADAKNTPVRLGELEFSSIRDRLLEQEPTFARLDEAFADLHAFLRAQAVDATISTSRLRSDVRLLAKFSDPSFNLTAFKIDRAGETCLTAGVAMAYDGIKTLCRVSFQDPSNSSAAVNVLQAGQALLVNPAPISKFAAKQAIVGVAATLTGVSTLYLGTEIK